ncbi:MAG: CocE/NonD family hydrolase [Solirubrobacteraceae bacterium]
MTCDNQRPANLKRVRLWMVVAVVAAVVALVGFGACSSNRSTSTTTVALASTAAVAPPATPAGQQLAWVLRVLNSGKSPSAEEIERHFSPSVLKVAPPAELVQSLGQIAAAQPLRLMAVLDRQGALRLQVRVAARGGVAFRATIVVGAGGQHLIEGLGFEKVGTTAPRPTYSLYVPMRDGVRIAVDVRLPKSWKSGVRVPAILDSTRYWRTSVDLSPFLAAGYATVAADVRGTGASFGTWKGSPSAAETADLGQLVDWIAAQPWSNGRVGAFGVSYDGTTAEMTAAARPKALKAIAPLFESAEPYTEAVRPGGLYDSGHLDRWSAYVKLLDSGRLPDGSTIALVGTDPGGALLAQALQQHRANFDVSVLARKGAFIDDRQPGLDYGWADAAAWTSRREVERSRVPVYVLDSWLDGGYMLTPLRRYALTSNRQTVVIGSWNHGGTADADPFRDVWALPIPSQAAQMRSVRAFFDAYLKTGGAKPPPIGIRYATLGAPGFRFSRRWPPSGLTPRRLYLAPARGLSWTRPAATAGADRYRVRFDATSGTQNRWWTLTGSDVFYPDRAGQDAKLITYTTAPLPRTVEMTGTGIVSLQVTSTARDGAFFAYLEDVAPNGEVRMITEGELRAINRKVIAERSPLAGFGPLHPYRRADAQPLQPGKVAELQIGLLPTSVLFKQGHRIRLAIAGADKDTFTRVPATGTPTITVQRTRLHASYLELPLRNR